MWNGGYTNSEGEILVDNDNTRAMLTYVKSKFENNMIALPIAWDQQYGSTNFKAGDSCMTVGSTAGIGYNVPDPGTFEIGVAPIPQWDMENYPSAVQQGPNVAIMKGEHISSEEQLAAWLFIKYITEAEQTAKWSMLTGYLPVRISGYESAVYQEFLGIADLHAAGTLDGHTFSSELNDFLGVPADYLYESMTANAAYLQVEYYEYDPAFSMIHASSSEARLQAGIVMEAIFGGTVTVDQVIQAMLDELS